MHAHRWRPLFHPSIHPSTCQFLLCFLTTCVSFACLAYKSPGGMLPLLALLHTPLLSLPGSEARHAVDPVTGFPVGASVDATEAAPGRRARLLVLLIGRLPTFLLLLSSSSSIGRRTSRRRFRLVRISSALWERMGLGGAAPPLPPP